MPKNKKHRTGSQDRFAPTAWGGASPMDPNFEELEVPSGQLCLVRRPGVQGLLRAGALTSVDSLTAKVSQYVTGADGTCVTEGDLAAMQHDPEAIAEMTRTMHRVVKHIVVRPQLEIPPEDITNRRDGVIYLDTVDLDDVVFLFNFAVAGVRDLERFRRAKDALVDRLAAEHGLGDAASRIVGGDGPGGGVVSESVRALVRKQPGDRRPKRRAGSTKRLAGRSDAPAGAGPLA